MNVLILCTGNSCRSQMGEAILKSFEVPGLNVYSAGIEKHGLNPWAMKVIEELSLPTNELSSKTLEELQHIEFDIVLTVCSNANETCPVYPKQTKLIHHSFEDPPALAKGLTKEEEILPIYRKVRDQIRSFLKEEFMVELK